MTLAPPSGGPWRRGLRTVLAGRCPSCSGASMFEGFYAVRERCPVCDTAFLDYESGMWLGAIALGYGIGALIAVLLAAVEVFFEPIRSLGLHPMWTIAAIALSATAIGYRWAKAWWFGLLYAYGFMERRGD